MAEQTRAPSSDDSTAGTWTGTAGSRWTVVDDHPDASGTDQLTHGTTAGNLTFGFSAFSIPAGSTGISVEVRYYDIKSASQASAIAARLKIGGTYHNATTHNPATSRTLRTDTFATNPKTSAAWTVDDVNGVGSNPLQAFGWFSNDASPTISLSSIQLAVTYTPPPVEGSQTEGSTAAVTQSVEFAGFSDSSFTGTSALTSDAEHTPGQGGTAYEAVASLGVTAGFADSTQLGASPSQTLSVTAGQPATSTRGLVSTQSLVASSAVTPAPTLSAVASQQLTGAATVAHGSALSATAVQSLTAASAVAQLSRLAAVATLPLPVTSSVTTGSRLDAGAGFSLAAASVFSEGSRAALGGQLPLATSGGIATVATAQIGAALVCSAGAALATVGETGPAPSTTTLPCSAVVGSAAKLNAFGSLSLASSAICAVDSTARLGVALPLDVLASVLASSAIEGQSVGIVTLSDYAPSVILTDHGEGTGSVAVYDTGLIVDLHIHTVHQHGD